MDGMNQQGSSLKSTDAASNHAADVINTVESLALRQFETGATRSPDLGRYDPEGFFSPIALEQYSIYMEKHQTQADGTRRTSDNWQKGLPHHTYMKGMVRHMLHLWTRHRGYKVQDKNAAASMEEDLCALMFNVQGMLHEVVKSRMEKEAKHEEIMSTYLQTR